MAGAAAGAAGEEVLEGVLEAESARGTYPAAPRPSWELRPSWEVQPGQQLPALVQHHPHPLHPPPPPLRLRYHHYR